jgi:DNA-binding transcriptional MerR regulator
MTVRLAIVLVALLSTVPALAQPMTVDSGGGSRPNPDPTILGLASQERAISALRELIDARIKATEEEIQRIKAGADYTDQRLLKRVDEVPSLIDTALTHLQKLMEEKFRGVDQQFAGRDVALAAALLAQKTSVDEQNKANAASSAKAEGATTKQIDGIQSIIQANSKGTDDKIESVKVLLASQTKGVDDKIAGLSKSVDDIRATVTAATARGEGQSQVWVYLVAGGSLLIAFAGIVLPRLHIPQQQPAYYPSPNGYPQQYAPAPNVHVVPVVPVGVPPTTGRPP